jgi:hypothetical protein
MKKQVKTIDIRQTGVAENPILGEGTVTKQQAVWNGKYYEHFGIRKEIAYMYGHKENEVSDVEMRVSADQRLPVSNDGDMNSDYWGWFDFERQEFTIIYAKRFLLNMCFTYGIEASEQAKQGKAYRLEVSGSSFAYPHGRSF